MKLNLPAGGIAFCNYSAPIKRPQAARCATLKAGCGCALPPRSSGQITSVFKTAFVQGTIGIRSKRHGKLCRKGLEGFCFRQTDALRQRKISRLCKTGCRLILLPVAWFVFPHYFSHTCLRFPHPTTSHLFSAEMVGKIEAIFPTISALYNPVHMTTFRQSFPLCFYQATLDTSKASLYGSHFEVCRNDNVPQTGESGF